MRVIVLGASGSVGREVVRQAVERGHEVVAVSRRPGPAAGVEWVAADVRDPAAIAAVLGEKPVVLDALGVSKGDAPGVLTAGARAIAAARPARAVALGALGSGPSARAAGVVTRLFVRLFMRAELPDKLESDATILAAGGTVLHFGPMDDGPISPARRLARLDEVPRRLLPAAVSAATVAASMLDALTDDSLRGEVAVPLS